MKAFDWKLTLLPLFFILLPLGIYYWEVYRFAIDVPFGDDYYNVLVSAMDTLESSNPLGTLFSLNNEHRIAFPRAVIILLYWLMGRIDFEWLIYLGNTGMAVLVYQFYLLFKRYQPKLSLWWFVPVPWLVLHMAYAILSIWTIATIQNIWILVFSFQAFIAWEGKGKNQLLLTALWASLATLTNGNGLFVWPLLTGLIFISEGWKKALPIAGLTVLAFGLYFIGFHSTATAKTNPMGDFLLHPEERISFALYFMFNTLKFSRFGNVLVMAVAYASVIYLSIKSYQGAHKRYFAVAGIVLFLAVSGLLTAYSRAYLGMGMPFTSRYMIYGPMTLVALYFLLLGDLKGWFRLGFVLAAGLLGLFFNMFYSRATLAERREHMGPLAFSIRNYNLRHDASGLRVDETDIALGIMARAIKGGYYDPQAAEQKLVQQGVLPAARVWKPLPKSK